MQTDRILLRSAARWFWAVLLLGVLLRSAFVWMYNPGPLMWGNLIHAHSHTAYFGWAGLGLMGLMLHLLPGLTGAPVAAPGAQRWLLRLAPWAVGGALVSFSLQGYGPVSIAFSTFNEVLWFLFAYIFWQSVKGRPIRGWPPALWLMGAAVALLMLSTLSTVLIILTRVVFKVSDPVLYNSGVYLFLQAYGDGWMEVGLMGAVAAIAGGLQNRRMAGWQATLVLTLTAPAAVRLLAPFGLPSGWLAVGALAGAGLAASQVLYLQNMRPPKSPWWAMAALALVLKAVLELLPLLPHWTELAKDRHLVIAYLHLKLLALCSAALIGAIASLHPGRRRGFWLFAPGTAVMLLALVAQGFLAPGADRTYMALAFAGGVVAAVGAATAVWPEVSPALFLESQKENALAPRSLL